MASPESASAPRHLVRCDTEKRSTVYWASLSNANSPRTTSLRVPWGGTACSIPARTLWAAGGRPLRVDGMLRARGDQLAQSPNQTLALWPTPASPARDLCGWKFHFRTWLLMQATHWMQRSPLPASHYKWSSELFLKDCTFANTG